MKKAKKLGNDPHAKKLREKHENRISEINRNILMIKSKSMIVSGLIFAIVIATFNSKFYGITVAKLPFSPPKFIRYLSHRNLPGNDMTDCSFIFWYSLCAYFFRNVIKRITATENIGMK